MYFQGVSHAPTARERGPSTSQFWEFPSIYASIPTRNYQIVVNTYGEMACFYGVRHAPVLRGRCPSASQFWEFLSIYVYTLCRRTTEFDVVTQVGEGCQYWGQPRLPSQGSAVPGLRNFGGSSTFMPTPFNAERPNSAW